uniref:Uncharacterized protein n=1 Tax=Rhizophora mucronata TaxID=61149 RepID=A0A2P2NMT4_RHIMU
MQLFCLFLTISSLFYLHKWQRRHAVLAAGDVAVPHQPNPCDINAV